MGPGDLKKALCDLPLTTDSRLIAGLESAEDAGVYRLSDDLAIVQTLDFFTPIVDDPYIFGQIAAANALSDVYAMGGNPVTAMNIVCFPVDTMDISVLKSILAGGLEKVREADTLLVGGHSVDDQELKYGLSVTGTIHPDRVVLNSGAVAGDRLVLTKPLGTGIINTAIKAGVASREVSDLAVRCMSSLNRTASEFMMNTGVNACTDVTGFGLLGHAAEMIENSTVGIVLYSRAVPVLPGTLEYVAMGLVPGGTLRNREYRSHMVEVSGDVGGELLLSLFDAQTSGGLLISITSSKAEGFVRQLKDRGLSDTAIIGEVVAEPRGKIVIR